VAAVSAPREEPSSNYTSLILSAEPLAEKPVSEFDTLSVPQKPKGIVYGTGTEELTQKVARALSELDFLP
jgi:hypothetical protein